MAAQHDTEHNAQVLGLVEFRAGDGPMMRIPEGPVLVVLGEDSAVIHWHDEGNALNAAIPLLEYQEHVENERISGPKPSPKR